VFEVGVRRRIFGPKRDAILGGWRELHNKELDNLYCPLDKIRMMKSRRMGWAGHVAHMGDKRSGYRVLVGIPEG
jgi:hypothetical protein